MKFLIVAAKTGGHVFPAATVSRKLINNNHQIVLLGTGNEIEKNAYEELNSKQYKISIDGFRGKNFFTKLKTLMQITINLRYLMKVIKKERVDAMIGFGGFISVPAGIACLIKGIPIFTHEQNSVMGSANKLLSKYAVINFLGFEIANIKNSIFSGNPIRDSFIDNNSDKRKEFENRINVYITGGSQGSSFINENMPSAMEAFSQHLSIKHQCGRNNLEKVKNEYESKNIDAEVSEFFNDPEEQIKWSDFVISRAGALSISEITSMKKGLLMIPLANSIDNHQYKNAKKIEDIGMGILHEEKEGISHLTAKIEDIINNKKYIDWNKNKYLNHVNAANDIVKHIEGYLNR